MHLIAQLAYPVHNDQIPLRKSGAVHRSQLGRGLPLYGYGKRSVSCTSERKPWRDTVIRSANMMLIVERTEVVS